MFYLFGILDYFTGENFKHLDNFLPRFNISSYTVECIPVLRSDSVMSMLGPTCPPVLVLVLCSDLRQCCVCAWPNVRCPPVLCSFMQSLVPSRLLCCFVLYHVVLCLTWPNMPSRLSVKPCPPLLFPRSILHLHQLTKFTPPSNK